MSGPSPLGRRLLVGAFGFLLLTAGCGSGNDRSPESGAEIDLSRALAFRHGDPRVNVIAPSEDATVVSPMRIAVETTNLSLSPAGETQDGEGHLHLIVDRGCLQPGLVIPNAAENVHLGDGSASTLIELTAGYHDICVQVGDGFHVAVAVVDRISVQVVEKHGRLSKVVSDPTARRVRTPPAEALATRQD